MDDGENRNCLLTRGAQLCHVGLLMREGSATPAAELLSVREASRKTGIPPRRLYKWVANEKIWSIRVGGQIMLHVDDVNVLALRKAS